MEDREIKNQFFQQYNAGRTWRKMLGHLSCKLWLATFLFALCGCLLTLSEVFAMRYLARLLSEGSADRALFLTIAFYVFLIIIARAAQELIIGRTAGEYNKIRMNYVVQVQERFMSMDLKYYENPSFQAESETAYACLETNQRGLEGIYQLISPLTADWVSLLALSVILATLSPYLMLLFGLAVAVKVICGSLVARQRVKNRPALMKAQRQSNVYSFQATDFSYGKESRVFGFGRKIEQYSIRAIRELQAALKRYIRLDTWLNLISLIFLIACDLAVFLIIARRYYDGMSLSIIIFYLSSTALLNLLIVRLSQAIVQIQHDLKDCQFLFGFLEANFISEESGRPFKLEHVPSIEFEQVSFTYPMSEQKVLDNCSFKIAAGTRSALVGLNGAGKTTLIKLLTGLFRPDEGRILIDGVDYTTFALADLQKIFAVVFQQVEPLALTIAENISCEIVPSDRGRIEEVLRQAGLWDKVMTYEKGIDQTMLKIAELDGAVLSGGENQKLMIARALYRKDTQVIVMDEPTAALDALAEEKIYRAFDQIMGSKTALFISHRLASTRFCDEILLLNGGRISERGTHDQLMAEDGLYAAMFREQGKYYQDENGRDSWTSRLNHAEV